MSLGKAVITAAGEAQRHLPLQTMVDSQGRNRKVLGLLVDEATSAGIEEVAIVLRPGTEELYRDAVEDVAANVTFIEQKEPLGYGHAVLTAGSFVGEDPFLLMVSDHVYVSRDPGQSCATQLIRTAEQEDCVVSAVQATHEGRLTDFGAIGGALFDAARDLFEVKAVVEKPTPTEAEQTIMTPGIRHGYYLSFFGMHVLRSSVLEILKERQDSLSPGQLLDLSGSLDEAARRGRYLAQVMKGQRYDLDCRHGLLIGQLAVSLSGRYRDEVLSSITDLLAKGAMGTSDQPRD
ncbi:MAG: sugar phosphate nucleotidyltransferase [Verrucomicrobiota bacterium]